MSVGAPLPTLVPGQILGLNLSPFTGCRTECKMTRDVGSWLLNVYKTSNPISTSISILRLDIDTNSNADILFLAVKQTWKLWWRLSARRQVGFWAGSRILKDDHICHESSETVYITILYIPLLPIIRADFILAVGF